MITFFVALLYYRITLKTHRFFGARLPLLLTREHAKRNLAMNGLSETTANSLTHLLTHLLTYSITQTLTFLSNSADYCIRLSGQEKKGTF